MKEKIKAGKTNRNRLQFIFLCLVILFCVLTLRLAYHQIIKGDEYARMAARQQTGDNIITALRGNILDRSGNPLAISATTHTVWVRTSSIRNNGETEEEIEENKKQEAAELSEILNLDYEVTLQQLGSDRALFRIAKNVDAEIADILRQKDFAGIEIAENSKRYYPMRNLASGVVGITTDDNVGLTGLELYYDALLSGTDGRWITSTDSHNNTIIFGRDKYYPAEDGYSIVTTIDGNLQRITEEIIERYKERFEATKVSAIVMDVTTGEIVVMAQTDRYDLNNPRTYKEGDEEYYLTLSESEQVEYWDAVWRNFNVCDIYEPGSTFKPITVALALDYGVTNMDEWFYCSGYKDVEDRTIHCWNWPWIHGDEDLTHAVVNSCNSVMIELEQRLGRTNYYNGLRTFCITEKTGIDYPGEGSNMIYPEKEAGPVERATMAFGQGIAVTPISLITALSSLANEGKLMQPHFIKQIVDSDGKVVENIEPVVRNITVSKETAADMLKIFEAVVTDGGAGIAAIPGYRIGGKTGTAYKAKNGEYSDEVATSFIGIAPIDDPKYSVLVVMDNPNSDSSTATAAACQREIMQQLLLLKNIAPTYSTEEIAYQNSQKVEIPVLAGQTLDDAMGILAGKGLECVISDDPGEGYFETMVKDQYPKAGSLVERGTTVTVYYK